MPGNSYVSLFAFNQADGTALASSTTPTSLLPAAAKYKLWANYFESLGKSIRIRAHGRISTLVTGPGTLTLQLRLTDSAATTVSVFDGGAMTLNIVAQTNTPWILDVTCMTRSVGSAGTLFGFGTFTSHAVIGAQAIGTGGATSQMLPYNAAPAVGTAFDMTLENRVDLFATWSVNSASNSITLHNYQLFSEN